MRRFRAAKRLTAGLFIGGALALGCAGTAHAQSCPSGSSGGSCTTVSTVASSASTTATTVRVGGTTLAKTGEDLWIPLTAGGGAIGIALVARRVSRRSVI